MTELLEATGRVVAQARQRLAGITASRRVSLHDPDARPIAKGRLGRPVEFGYKVQVVDNDDGIVLDRSLVPGNPADAPQLAPAVQRVIARTGRRPRIVTADRGYGEKSVEDNLHDLGVRGVAIPRKGKPSTARQAHEHRRAFRRAVKWRTGSEGWISSPKRGNAGTEPAWTAPKEPGSEADTGPGAQPRHDRSARGMITPERGDQQESVRRLSHPPA